MEQLRPRATEAMFYGDRGTNINIYDGTFVQHNQPPSETTAVHNCYEARDGFSHLQAHVATSAFDSADQADDTKCHPNTRIAVLDDIMSWVLLSVARSQWILWLNGAAGAGKSAIARSIAALCLENHIPIARFFFFRSDFTRNTIKPLVPTLLHQLVQQIPDLFAIIVPLITSDPLIFTKSLETQLRCLIFDPLQELHSNSLLKSVVVLMFDGVDECNGHDSQMSLIRLIASFLKTQGSPIIAFFSSRTESQLQQVFRLHEVSSILRQLALDNNYHPDIDIRFFLDAKFKLIREAHRFCNILPQGWPDAAHVQEIVDKSSGQFVYAAVVIHFVSGPHQHPARQLEIIRGLRPAGGLTPFAQLDALYHHIFSQVKDSHSVSRILALAIFHSHWDIYGPNNFDVDVDDLEVILADLSPVLVCENRPGYYDSQATKVIRFLHASLPDFLLDKSRSERYHIDKRLWCTEFTHCCLRNYARDNNAIAAFWSLAQDFLPFSALTDLVRQHALTLDFVSIYAKSIWADRRSYVYDYLIAIHAFDFGDGGQVYRDMLYCLSRYILDRPYPCCLPAVIDLTELVSSSSSSLDKIHRQEAAERVLRRDIPRLLNPMSE